MFSIRLKIILFSLPLFLIMLIVLIKVIPTSKDKVTLVAVAQAMSQASSSEESIETSSMSDSKDLAVDSVTTKYFKARLGTTWEFSGYNKEQGEEGAESSDDVKSAPYTKKLIVNKIQKSGDNYNLELVNSVNGKNENWLVNDREFFDGNSYIIFPLYYGKRWLSQGEDNGSEWVEMTKNRADGFYQNRVEEVLKNKVLGNDCYVVGYNTLPDRFYSIFCQNIGIVEEFYKHNGTISEYREQLVQYHY